MQKRLFENLGSVKQPNPTKGAYSTPYEPPSCKGQCVDACWVMAYGHKAQSFMKNGGQKSLDKALSY